MMENYQPVNDPDELLDTPNLSSADLDSSANLERRDSSPALQRDSPDADRTSSVDDLFLDYYASFTGIAEKDKLSWRTRPFENSKDI